VNIPHPGGGGRGYLVSGSRSKEQLMRPIPVAPSTARLGKWCACVLLLLAPGSFVILPIVWLARRWRLASVWFVRAWWAR
jgi:hypothetical protein